MFKFKLGYVEEQLFLAVSVNSSKNGSFMVDVQPTSIKQFNHVLQRRNQEFQCGSEIVEKVQIQKYKNTSFKKLNTIKHH